MTVGIAPAIVPALSLSAPAHTMLSKLFWTTSIVLGTIYLWPQYDRFALLLPFLLLPCVWIKDKRKGSRDI